MYIITSEGERIALCEAPRYIKVNPRNGCFVQAEETDAQGVAVMGNPYNLSGHTEIMRDVFIPTEGGEEGEGTVERRVAPEVEIERMDSYAFLKSISDQTSAAEDAVCDLDISTDERMSAIEDSICELDEIINGGAE